MVVDMLAKRLNIRFKHYQNWDIGQNQDNYILVKPKLFMNNSGAVIRDYLQSNLNNFDFVVICDDWSLPLGKIRIRERGSGGGHHGLASIVFHLKTMEFARIRVGIGPLPVDIIPADFVLSSFTKQEKSILDKIIDVSCEASITIKQDGITKAMNRFNALDLVRKAESN